MGDNKNSKKLLWYWIGGAIAFVAIIIGLLINFLNIGKSTAVSQAQGKQIAYANIWSNQIHEEIQKATEYGGLINDIREEKGLAIDSNEIVGLAHKVVNNTIYYHIFLCRDDQILCDDMGETYEDVDLSGIEHSDEITYAYFKDRFVDRSNTMAVCIPSGDDGSYMLFMLDVRQLGNILAECGVENLSFLVLFKKDGMVCCTIDKFADVYSPFLTKENFLDCVMEGCSNKEDYNNFKTKLYNNNPGVIESVYMSDARTIVGAPVGIEELYIGYGIRQYQMDSFSYENYKDARSAAIKLIIVFAFFAGFAVSVVIISSIKSREKGKKLESQADTDLLTELYNKAATERKIQEYIDENPNGRALMFILDVDNFKKVNDTMGHAFGDTLLKTLGKEIRTEFRLTDIVGRTGGDEFIIFLKDVTDNLIVEREANRLTRFFHDFKAGGDYVKYSATASIGAAIYPDDANNFKELYVDADQALYRAKKRGKNQLVFFNEDRYSNAQ